jgi:hypothetical protein
MRSIFLAGLLILGSAAAWCQGASGSSGQPLSPGAGSPGVASSIGGNAGAAIPEATFRSQCLTSLSAHASEKLQAQLLKDKAVTQQVRANARIGETQLGASCNKLCDDYAQVSSKISWAHVSPGFLSEPEHTLQQIYTHMPKPALPGKAEADTCLPQQAMLNWCPPSGTGVGAGPSRQENPLDKIRVCITVPDAFQHMNFSAADVARNCAKPAIVDAADRIKAERNCVDDAVKADAKAAEAANKAAGVYAGPAIGAQPVAGGLVTARKKP